MSPLVLVAGCRSRRPPRPSTTSRPPRPSSPHPPGVASTTVGGAGIIGGQRDLELAVLAGRRVRRRWRSTGGLLQLNVSDTTPDSQGATRRDLGRRHRSRHPRPHRPRRRRSHRRRSHRLQARGRCRGRGDRGGDRGLHRWRQRLQGGASAAGGGGPDDLRPLVQQLCREPRNRRRLHRTSAPSP